MQTVNLITVILYNNQDQTFHPDKWNIPSVTQNRNLIKSNYTIHSHLLESLEEAKYIGPTIRQDLEYESHVNINVCTKANKTFGFLHHNVNISSTFIKEQAYKSLISPSHEYLCSAWDNYNESELDEL
jgi:hypothetical protein